MVNAGEASISDAPVNWVLREGQHLEPDLRASLIHPVG